MRIFSGKTKDVTEATPYFVFSIHLVVQLNNTLDIVSNSTASPFLRFKKVSTTTRSSGETISSEFSDG